MRAIILAGGKGTRLQSEVPNLPKPLAPVRNQPFLYILMRFLAANGVSEIAISTFHMADQFRARLPELKKLAKKVTLVEEPAALGTGGAIRFACSELKPTEHVLVLNGDTYFGFDLGRFLKKHAQENALALKRVANSSRYGTVATKSGRVAEFLEKSTKGGSGTIYAGYCILNVGDLRRLLPEGPSSLETDFFPGLLREGKALVAEEFPGEFIDIGIPADYQHANSAFDFSGFLT